MKLTETQKSVLYGLVRWPDSTDNQISTQIGIKRSTVTTIRQRLERLHVVKKVNIPSFESIGCELITTMYGEFQPTQSRRENNLRKTIREELSRVFYMARSEGQHLSFGAAENLTKIRQHIMRHHSIHHESGYFTDKRHNLVLFPLKYTNISRFFDYAPLLANYFKIEDISNEVKKEFTELWKPTKRERQTLHSIVKHPTGRDEEIGSMAGVSRQTVNALRNKFQKNGLFKSVRIPDVKGLGFNIMAFTHLHMNPQEGKKHLTKCQPNQILKLQGDLETTILSVYRDFGEYRRGHRNEIEQYRRDGLILEEPHTRIFALDQTDELVKHEYARILD